MNNYLKKIMFRSSAWVWSYLIIYFAFSIVAMKFSKMLGLAFDVAKGTKRDYWNYAQEICIITILMIIIYFIFF